MGEIVSGEVIQQLEKRHVELIEELDALNHRLEEALNSFQQVTTQPTPPHVLQKATEPAQTEPVPEG